MQQSDDMEVPLLNDTNSNRQKSLGPDRDGFSHLQKDSEVIRCALTVCRGRGVCVRVRACAPVCVCVRWLVAGGFKCLELLF